MLLDGDLVCAEADLEAAKGALLIGLPVPITNASTLTREPTCKSATVRL